MRIEPLTPAVGAVVSGVDLGQVSDEGGAVSSRVRDRLDLGGLRGIGRNQDGEHVNAQGEAAKSCKGVGEGENGQFFAHDGAFVFEYGDMMRLDGVVANWFPAFKVAARLRRDRTQSDNSPGAKRERIDYSGILRLVILPLRIPELQVAIERHGRIEMMHKVIILVEQQRG